jgi:nucleoside diphosphate kinase
MGNNLCCGDSRKDGGSEDISFAEKRNQAFVFVKPHADNDAVRGLVKQKLADAGIRILKEDAIKAEVIDSKMLIDTHYGAIAAKAMKLKPDGLTVQPEAQERFKNTFDIEWADALKDGLVFNAMDASAKLGVDYDGLGEKWSPLKDEGKLVKLGGGFYVGKMDDIYCINGFYMDMRKKFTAPGASIYYMSVEWDADTLPWGDFRKKVLGGTNPEEAADGSIRKLILTDWENLGLKSMPNTGDNGVHASASPFEAFCERCNWMGVPLSADPFGRALVAKGIPQDTVKSWMSDPSVTYEEKKTSLFDLLEDTGGKECLYMCTRVKP